MLNTIATIIGLIVLLYMAKRCTDNIKSIYRDQKTLKLKSRKK